MAPPHDERPHEHPELQRSDRWSLPAEPSEPSGDQPQARDTDLLSLGLFVFFVALIGVVGALLLMPALGLTGA